MILVLLGTNPYDFSRLAVAMDEYARKTGKVVFIQLGHTVYEPKFAQWKRFLEKEELLKKITEADVVVTQGGFGSIADALIAGKKVVAVPRKPELNESPDVQEELVRELERIGRVIAVYDIERLPEAIERSYSFKATTGQAHSIGRLIEEFISKEDKRCRG